MEEHVEALSIHEVVAGSFGGTRGHDRQNRLV
jgi:hypothetical protein